MDIQHAMLGALLDNLARHGDTLWWLCSILCLARKEYVSPKTADQSVCNFHLPILAMTRSSHKAKTIEPGCKAPHHSQDCREMKRDWYLVVTNIEKLETVSWKGAHDDAWSKLLSTACRNKIRQSWQWLQISASFKLESTINSGNCWFCSTKVSSDLPRLNFWDSVIVEILFQQTSQQHHCPVFLTVINAIMALRIFWWQGTLTVCRTPFICRCRSVLIHNASWKHRASGS